MQMDKTDNYNQKAAFYRQVESPDMFLILWGNAVITGF